MGGLNIVSTWLSQAAVEEQTSVILVIFKVRIVIREQLHLLLYCMDSELMLIGAGASPPPFI